MNGESFSNNEKTTVDGDWKSHNNVSSMNSGIAYEKIFAIVYCDCLNKVHNYEACFEFCNGLQ